LCHINNRPQCNIISKTSHKCEGGQLSANLHRGGNAKGELNG
jgi:hypothetical protein